MTIRSLCRLLSTALLLHGPAVAATLAPHRAIYALTLTSAHDEGVVAASGSMSFDLQDTCGGMVTAQHLAIDLTDRDGHDLRMVSDYATFEARDGTRLDFHSRQRNGADVTAALEGTAALDGAARHGTADYISPARRRVALPPGTRLPNAHTAAILDAAQTGARFLSIPLFDGTSPDGAQDTFVTLARHLPPRPGKWPALARLGSTRVHVAFFDRSAAAETPDYEIGMRYFDNGVADDLTMDFGDFVMQGTLSALTLHPAARC